MANKLLNDDIAGQVRALFAQIEQPVRVLFFASEEHCDTCADTRQLVEEVVSLSDKLSLSVYDVVEDVALAEQYRVDKTPGIVIAGLNGDQVVDYGVRYAGIPSGHEFSSLIHDLIQVSRRDSGLSEATRTFLSKLENPIHLQVFVTPTCPYCPRAVLLAHQMAMESPLVEAEMVEAMEFPDLADQFGVSGVPHTTINAGAGAVIGAVPEDYLIAEIQRALEGVPAEDYR